MRSTVAPARPAPRDPQQRRGLARPDGRPRRQRSSRPAGVVAAGVRVPRARRAPDLPRADHADARPGRAALRQLGPGRHRHRAAVRPAGARRSSAPPWWRRRMQWPTSTPRSRTTTGAARASAATAACSTSPRSGATTSTTSSTTCTTWPTLAERVTIGSYDAYAGEYASGTSAMPDEVTDNLNRFVDLVGTEARVLEIGSRPRARRRWRWSRSASASGAPTSVPRVRRAPPRRRVPRRPARPAPRRPHRHAARRGAVRRRLGRRVPAPRRRGSPCPIVLARLAAVTRPGGTLHMTLKEGDGARLVGARARRRAALLHLLARGPAARAPAPRPAGSSTRCAAATASPPTGPASRGSPSSRPGR